MKRSWMTGLAQQAKPGTRRKGDRAHSRQRTYGGPNGPAPRPQLGRRVRDGLKPVSHSAGDVVPLESFLDQPPEADLAAAKQIAAAMEQTGLGQPDPEALRLEQLDINRTAVAAADDVVGAMTACPPAEKSGVTAAQISQPLEVGHALTRLDRTLEWAEGQVQTGKQVVETWQAEAQADVAGELLLELAGAKDQAEWLEIAADGAEVLELEEKALSDRIATREQGKTGRKDLTAQAADAERDVLFLKTMRDIRDRKPPSRAVLESMAQYYATLYDGNDDSAAAPAPPPPPAKGTPGTTHRHPAKK